MGLYKINFQNTSENYFLTGEKLRILLCRLDCRLEK